MADNIGQILLHYSVLKELLSSATDGHTLRVAGFIIPSVNPTWYNFVLSPAKLQDRIIMHSKWTQCLDSLTPPW